MFKRLGIISREAHNRYPWGEQTHFYEQMLAESRDIPVDVFFFDPIKWKLNSLLIEGFRYENGWITSEETIPTIIYDRYRHNSDHSKSIYNEMKRFLVCNGFKFTTAPELVKLVSNKLNFKDFLYHYGYPTLDALLLADLSLEILDKYLGYNNAIYIKPMAGAKGENIALLVNNNGLLRLKKQKYETEIDSKHIIAQLKNIFDENSYIVQPKAKVIDLNGSPFDIRVLVQNKGNNNYFITGMGVRIGEKGSLVSNLNANGKALPIEKIADFYTSNYCDSFDSALNLLRSTCLECTQQLHSIYGDFVEIAYDILLTTDKGPIILEANSKPGRRIFYSIANSSVISSRERSNFLVQRKISAQAPVVFVHNQIFD